MLAAGVPWVGRTRELEQLGKAWERAPYGLRVITITGEPGIGKTRLAAEFLAELSGQGARVLRGRCPEFLGSAFTPLVEALRADLAGRGPADLVQRLGSGAGELVRLVPELSEAVPLARTEVSADPALARMRILEALAAWLRSAAATDRVCLFLDDVHWADPETMSVIEYLVGACRELPLLVLLTSRELESAQADAFLAGPLQPSGTVARIPLTGLSDDEVDRLIGAELLLGGAAPQRSKEFVGRVRDVAGGNPLFVRELARQRGDGHGGSRAGDEASAVVPAALADVIRQRAARLPDPVRLSLQTAAVIGREFDPAVLAEAVELPVSEVDRHLTAATAASLVEEHSAAPLRYRFCHDAVRTALYDGHGPLQRADLHRRVGGVLQKRVPAAASESHHRALGHHLGRSGEPELERRASMHLRRAAELSSDRRGHAAAAQLYSRAESLLGEGAPAAERCDLMIARGTVEFYAGIPAFRDTLLDAAREAARTDQVDQLVRAVVANHRGWYSSTTGVDRERVELIELALLRCPREDSEALARLNAMWAMENVRDPGERARVLERSIAAATIAEEVADPDLLISILCDRFSVMYASFENPRGCVELAKRIEQLARTSGDEGHLLNAAVAVAQSTMMTGDFATSDDALALAEVLAARVHRPVRLWLAQVWIATRTAMRGDLERGESLAGAALEYGVSLDQPDAFTWYAGQLFSLRFLGNRIAELVDAIEEQVAEHAAAVPAWQAGLAYAFAVVGRTEEAKQIVSEFAAQELGQLPYDMIRLPGLAFLASAVAALEDRGTARMVYDALAPYTTMFAHNGTVDAGPIDLHLGALAVTLEDPALARVHLADAAWQCESVGAAAWQPHVDHWLRAAEALTARRASHYLAQGQRHWFVGEQLAAYGAYDHAWEIAAAEGAHTEAARAAVGPELDHESTGQRAMESARRCAAVLPHLAPHETALRRQVLLTMALAEFATDPTRGRESVQRVRRSADQSATGDPVAELTQLVAEALAAGPFEPRADRLVTAQRILTEVETQNIRWLANAAYFLLLSALLEAGETPALDAALSWRSSFLTRMPHLMTGRIRGRFRCARALLDGDTDRAAAIAAELLADTEAVDDGGRSGAWLAQSAVIAWQRGDSAALESLFLRARQEEPHEPLWPTSLAWLWQSQGRADAAAALVALLPEPATLLQGRNGLATLTVWAELARVTGDRGRMTELLELLVPHAGRVVTIGSGLVFWGTVDRPLGLVHECLGRPAQARRHLEAARDLCLRVGAQPWLVEAQLTLAEFGDRNADPDLDVAGLASQALAGARRMGMPALAASAQRLLDARATAEAHEGRLPAVATNLVENAAEGRTQIRVLGGFAVVGADGSHVRWTSRKARTLLKYLVASRGAAVHRESAMHLLWPDEEPENLANRFSVALATVRRALDPARAAATQHHVQLHDDLLRLNLEHLDIDLDEFHALAVSGDRAALRKALKLYRGDPFADEADAEWTLGVRAQAQLAVRHATTRLARLEAERGDLIGAAGLFRKVLADDPHSEAAGRGLAGVLRALGAHAEADQVEAGMAEFAPG